MCSDQSVPRRCIIVLTMHRTLLYCTRVCVQLLSVAVRVLSLLCAVTDQRLKSRHAAVLQRGGERKVMVTLKRCLSAAGEVQLVGHPLNRHHFHLYKVPMIEMDYPPRVKPRVRSPALQLR